MLEAWRVWRVGSPSGECGKLDACLTGPPTCPQFFQPTIKVEWPKPTGGGTGECIGCCGCCCCCCCCCSCSCYCYCYCSVFWGKCGSGEEEGRSFHGWWRSCWTAFLIAWLPVQLVSVWLQGFGAAKPNRRFQAATALTHSKLLSKIFTEGLKALDLWWDALQRVFWVSEEWSNPFKTQTNCQHSFDLWFEFSGELLEAQVLPSIMTNPKKAGKIQSEKLVAPQLHLLVKSWRRRWNLIDQ